MKKRKNYLAKGQTLDDVRKGIPKGGLQSPSLRKGKPGVNYARARQQGIVQKGTITGDFGNVPGGKSFKKSRSKKSNIAGVGNFSNVLPKGVK